MTSTKKTNRQSSKRTRNPEEKKSRIIEAATQEFAAAGLNGARVDSIIAQAGVNKQLLYYYFEDKENLYTVVLEKAYADLRIGEQVLGLAALAPKLAMTRFIEFSFDYLAENTHFVALISDENLHKARHLSDSKALKELHKKLREIVGGTLSRGLAEGVFKREIDPVDLYISISSLCFFHFSNMHTISAIFERKLDTKTAIAHRRRLVVDIIMAFLTSESTPEK